MGAKKILVVDDEPDVLSLHKDILKKAGYNVIDSSDGVQAMFKIRNSDFDLIITDIKMPRLTGDKMLADLLAAEKGHSQRRIIIYSGFIDLKLVEKFKGQPHIGFLAKPATTENLLKEVKRLLED